MIIVGKQIVDVDCLAAVMFWFCVQDGMFLKKIYKQYS